MGFQPGTGWAGGCEMRLHRHAGGSTWGLGGPRPPHGHPTALASARCGHPLAMCGSKPAQGLENNYYNEKITLGLL